MNAEIYFPRNGRAFGQTSEKSFEDTIKKLAKSNVHIIYKTEINLTEDSIVEALKVTESGEEKIGLIFIADALESDSMQKAKKFFEDVGIVGKVKRIEATCKDPMDEYSDSSKEPSESENKKKKKKNKRQNAELEEELIDISGSHVTIEKKKLYAYTVEYKNKLIVLLPPAEMFDTSFCTVLYTAAKKIVAPKKKRSFWKRFIPCKGDRPFDVVRKIILILATCTFLVSSYLLLDILVIQPWRQLQIQQNVRDLKDQGQKTDDNAKKAKDGSDGILSDFSKLVETNPDTVGWITIPNTKVDYAVVRYPGDEERVANGEDPYYLYKDFYRNDSYWKYGTIFMDYRSNLDSKNMILHGHHMQDGSMFAKITEFDDLDRYKGTPVFTFDTIYEKAKWKIIAVIKTNTLKYQGDPIFNYLRGSFSSDYDFMNFVYQLRVRSIIDCPVAVNENDTLVTLSTCCYDYEEFRFVIVARKVREGESATVDVSKARENPTPLYPQICHDNWGIEKPLVTSFQDAYNNGKIDWYDGDGTWSSADDRELTKLLTEGKENAEKMLREGYNKEEYKQEQIEEIESIIDYYLERINNASKGSDVNELYAQAITEIGKVKTIADLKREEEESKKAEEAKKKEELKKAKENAIQEINDSTSGKTYKDENYKKIIKDYTKKINESKDISTIEQLKVEAIDKLSKQEKKITEEESKISEESRIAAELSEYKSDAIRTLYGFVKSAYSDYVKNGLVDLINEYQSKITDASDKKEVDSLLDRAERAFNRKAIELAEEEENQSSQNSENSNNDSAELAAYKANAVNMLNGYMDTSQYSDSVKSRLDDLISEYAGYINEASSKSAIDSLLNEAKGYLDIMANEDSEESGDENSQDEESSDDEAA